MRTWKRLFSCLLAGAMALSLAACGGGASASDGRTAEDQTREETTPSTDASTDAAPEDSGDAGAADGGNVLVVYYSATGNTETVANHIAEATGGDIFDLTPAEPYTSDDLDWTDENSRVSREYADESLRDVALTATEVENWDGYDTVFIGYPIWWGVAAWPASSFVAANDFTGKTVIPFCTSSSSGLRESGDLLAELAASGDWQEGERFRSSASQEDVNEWVDSLGL